MPRASNSLFFFLTAMDGYNRVDLFITDRAAPHSFVHNRIILICGITLRERWSIQRLFWFSGCARNGISKTMRPAATRQRECRVYRRWQSIIWVVIFKFMRDCKWAVIFQFRTIANGQWFSISLFQFLSHFLSFLFWRKKNSFLRLLLSEKFVTHCQAASIVSLSLDESSFRFPFTLNPLSCVRNSREGDRIINLATWFERVIPNCFAISRNIVKCSSMDILNEATQGIVKVLQISEKLRHGWSVSGKA